MHRHAKFGIRFGCGSLLALLVSACHILPPLPNVVRDMGPRYRPNNVYRAAGVLPMQIRRVALLPLVAQSSTGFLKPGVETMEPLLLPELEKCKRFEVVAVSPEDLRQWTGKTGWRTDEPLPPDFFARISEATGCDAVFFSQLVRYEPYQPVAVGWKFSLIANPEVRGGGSPDMRNCILWAADEVLDAGEPGVANAARDYYSQHLRNEAASADATTVLSSPLMFGRYSMAALFETLPARLVPARETAKVETKSGR